MSAIEKPRRTPDTEAMELLSKLFPVEAGGVVELRSLPQGKEKPLSFTAPAKSLDRIVDKAMDWNRSGRNVWYCLNVLPDGFKPDYAGGAVKDKHVERRCRFMTDFDAPKADAKSPATAEQASRAAETAMIVCKDLSEGFDFPPPEALVFTGNGAQAIHGCDLPNDKASYDLLDAYYTAIATMYPAGTYGANIDPAVKNASRVGRLPGTVNYKPNASAELPNRRARILHMPASSGLVTVEMLQGVIDYAKSQIADDWAIIVPRKNKGLIAKAESPAEAYIRAALAGELEKIAKEPAGGQHNRIRASATALGGFIHLGIVSRAEIAAELVKAALALGETEKRAKDVVEWGLNRGEAAPRQIPKSASKAKQSQQTPATIPIRPDDTRPLIVCGSQEPTEGLKTWTPAALDALKRSNEKELALFQRADQLCRLARPVEGDDPPHIETLGVDALRGVLDRAAFWGTERMTRSGPAVNYGPPRLEIVRDIMALGELDPEAFPPLEIVAESPRFDASGELILKPGYHRHAKLFYAPVPELKGLEIPTRPSPRDIQDAKTLLLGELLGDFPFANAASRANALAVMLLPFIRLMIEGPTPNHHFTASTEGTGKGLCASACAFPYLGRDPDLNAQKESEAEWRKALTSFFLSGASHYFIDNMYNPPGWDDIPQDVGSGTLAAAWTVTMWRDRILGGQDEARVKVQSVFMSTGNNIVFSRELNRRIVRIELLAPMENPSLRTGFKHPELMGWAKKNRADLTRACLTLCRHWIAEGKPSGEGVMGSYEAYASMMSGVLASAGVSGFLANRPKAVKQDPESGRWSALVFDWHRIHGFTAVSTAELYKLITKSDDLSERFSERLGEGSEQSQKTRLGKALEAHEGRVWADWRITKASIKAANKGVLWKLRTPAELPDEAPDDDDSDWTSRR